MGEENVSEDSHLQKKKKPTIAKVCEIYEVVPGPSFSSIALVCQEKCHTHSLTLYSRVCPHRNIGVAQANNCLLSFQAGFSEEAQRNFKYFTGSNVAEVQPYA